MISGSVCRLQNLMFVHLLRMSRSRTNPWEPWMIALIVLGILLVLATAIGLLVYFLIYNQKLFFYNASFRINNVQYQPNFDKQTSAEFRELSRSIEVLIKQAFQATPLEKRLINARVVRLSPGNDGVLADVLLIFKFIATDNKEILWTNIYNCLLKKLKSSTWPLSIDISSYKLSGNINVLIPDKNSFLGLGAGCGTRLDRSVERIYGGTIAGEGEWPWQASLQLNGVHRCGATLISNNWLVTAAHCFRGVQNVRSWTSSFGARLRPPTMRRNLRQIIIHEHYANNIMNHEFDIAVVQISSPVEFTTAVHRVCLPEASYIFPENTTCAVTGFGALKDDGPSVHELRQTEVKIIGNEICNKRGVYNGAISSGMLCAGYLEGGSDACQVG
ncbi:Transmembrane protease serine 11E, partial [Ophiophagus hannah]